MCGLSGYISSPLLLRAKRIQRDAIVRGLLLAMQERGEKSTGIGGVYKDKHFMTKKTLDAWEFVKDTDFAQSLLLNPSILLGHTRQPTSGAVTMENAHPFLKGNIMGTHNGSVWNEKDFDEKVEVDSEIIFVLLDQEKGDYTKVFHRLRGMFALAWIDITKPDRVYLAREDNPLYMCTVPSLKTIFWASTRDALRFVIGTVIGTDMDIIELEKNTVYEIKHDLSMKGTDTKFAEYKDTCMCHPKEEIKPIDIPTYPTENGWSKKQWKKHLKKRRKQIEKFKQNNKNDAWLAQYYTNRYKVMKTRLDRYGCDTCGSRDIVEPGFYWHFKDQFIMCSKCIVDYRHKYDFELVLSADFNQYATKYQKDAKEVTAVIYQHD